MLKEAQGVKRFILKTGKTDLRYGIDRLASIIRMEYGLEPLEEGTLFLFCGGRKDRIKCMLYESDGFLLITKRLTEGSFLWPANENEVREMTGENFRKLLGGYEIESFTKTHMRFNGNCFADGSVREEKTSDK